MTRLQRAFDRHPVLVTFVTAGFPSMEVFPQVLLSLQRSGSGVIEVGVPFSDPTADGAVIQEASHVALRNGASLTTCLEWVRMARVLGLHVPVVLMGYRATNQIHKPLSAGWRPGAAVRSSWRGRHHCGRPAAHRGTRTHCQPGCPPHCLRASHHPHNRTFSHPVASQGSLCLCVRCVRGGRHWSQSHSLGRSPAAGCRSQETHDAASGRRLWRRHQGAVPQGRPARLSSRHWLCNRCSHARCRATVCLSRRGSICCKNTHWRE